MLNMKRVLSYLVLIICVTNLFIYSGCSELDAELENKQQNEINNSDDTLKVIISDDYIEGFTSVLFSNGNFILIRPDSIEGFYLLFDSLFEFAIQFSLKEYQQLIDFLLY